MCIIIDKPENVNFPMTDLEIAVSNNPDGFGVMWTEPGLNQVMFRKSLKVTAADVAKTFDHLIDAAAVFHLRYCTVGEVSVENAHPLPVLNRNEHGTDLFVMHNGTIDIKTDGKESDTSTFVRLVLRPMLTKCPEILDTQAFQFLVEQYIGESKLVFLDGSGKVTKLNEGLGTTRNGCWVSNTYAFRSKVTTASGKPILSKFDADRDFEKYFEMNEKQQAEREAPLFDYTGFDDIHEYSPFANDGYEPARKYKKRKTWLSTDYLISLSDMEIFDLVTEAPDDISDWIIDQLSGDC